MLKAHYFPGMIEAGCDEAGRGCLAGSVYAAAVILPPDYTNTMLNDSKQLTERRRYALREQVERDAVAWAVGVVTADEIDEINILHASFLAMHRAIDQLRVCPEALIIDGNRFDPYKPVGVDARMLRAKRVPVRPDDPGILPYRCIVKGDAKYLSIAAASILAKTYRDDYMLSLHEEYPMYDWNHNKGYPTYKHYLGIEQHGITPYHRKSYNLFRNRQLKLDFDGEE